MTTLTPRKKASRKPLRIRPEFLPESAVYGAFAGREYVMIPVEDFGDWYEDIEANAIAEERRRFDDGPAVPVEDILAGIRSAKATKQ